MEFVNAILNKFNLSLIHLKQSSFTNKYLSRSRRTISNTLSTMEGLEGISNNESTLFLNSSAIAYSSEPLPGATALKYTTTSKTNEPQGVKNKVDHELAAQTNTQKPTKDLRCIYRQKFNVLKKLLNSSRKADLLEHLVSWWQISHYKLNDEQIWFTRSYDYISEQAGLSERTLNRYLNDFEAKGFIQRKSKIAASGKGDNFSCKKRTYICITPKLLDILDQSIIANPEKTKNLDRSTPLQPRKPKTVPVLVTPETQEPSLLNLTQAIGTAEREATEVLPTSSTIDNMQRREFPSMQKIKTIISSQQNSTEGATSKASENLDASNIDLAHPFQGISEKQEREEDIFEEVKRQNGVNENAILSLSIYKDNNTKENNNTVNSTVRQDSTVTFSNINPTHSFDLGPEKEERKASPKAIYSIEAKMEETYSPRLKNLVKGMLANVQQQNGIRISDPEKVFAEVIFSITQDAQWGKITDYFHRINIVAKLLKQNKWRTPKGFYKYWQIGQYFYDREQKQRELYQRQKQEECKQPVYFPPATKATRPIAEAIPPLEKSPEVMELKRSLRKIEDTIFGEKAYVQRQIEFAKGAKTPETAAIHQAPIDAALKKIVRLNAEKEETLAKIEAMLAKVA